MSFKKLALVSAMFAATSGAFAMEALDEEAMAATTGQDGITVTITTPNTGITMNQIIHDKDGYAAGADGAAIVIGSLGASAATAMSVVNTGGAITLNIDAASTVATGANPYLNIGVALTGTTTIHTGDIRVASSVDSANGVGIGSLDSSTANRTPIVSGVLMNDMTIQLNATTMNIQLGAEPQGAMIKVATTMTGGLTINKMKLNDGGGAFTGGSLAIDSQKITNATGTLTDLNVNADVDMVAGGLRLNLATVGTGGMNVDIKGVRLGASNYAAAEGAGWTVAANAGQANANLAASIGDIEIRGLNLNGTTITVAGH